MTPTVTDELPAPVAAESTGSLLDEPTFAECHAEWLR